MKHPTISMLVPTWQNPWYLEQTIRSAMAGSKGGVEAVVFSQEHRQETEDCIKKMQDDGLNVLLIGTSPHNEGVALAVNACADASMGEYVFYTGDDYWFLPGWDEALMRRVKLGEWQYLTPRSIEPTGNNPSMYAPHDFGRGPEDFKPDALAAWWATLKKQDVVSRYGPPFVHREIWRTVGGFDTGYFPGFATDPDFAIGVGKAALGVKKEPSFVAVGDCGCYHFQCISTSRIKGHGVRLAAEKRFMEKWGISTRDFGAHIREGTPL